MTDRPHLPSHDPTTPGPRTRVTLDIAENSLEDLRRGQYVERVWISENEEDGVWVYTLHAQRTLGQARESGQPVAADLLVGLMNELVDSINEHVDEMPQAVLDTLDGVTERWIARNDPDASNGA